MKVVFCPSLPFITPVHQAVTLVHSTDPHTGYERTMKHSLLQYTRPWHSSTALTLILATNARWNIHYSSTPGRDTRPQHWPSYWLRTHDETFITPVHQAVTLVHSTDPHTGYERTMKHSLLQYTRPWHSSTALTLILATNARWNIHYSSTPGRDTRPQHWPSYWLRTHDETFVTPVHQAVTLVHSADPHTSYELIKLVGSTYNGGKELVSRHLEYSTHTCRPYHKKDTDHLDKKQGE